MEPEKTTASVPDKAYSELLAVIVKAVPEIRQTDKMHTCGLIAGCKGCEMYEHTEDRHITLKDVVDAIRKVGSSDLHYCPDGGQSVWGTIWDMWHIGIPLSAQSDELKSFLHTLLVLPQQ